MVLDVYRHPDFFDRETCRRIRRAMDAGRVDEAEVLGEEIALGADTRRALSIEVDDSLLAEVEARLEAERGAIGTFFGVPPGEREGAGFLRYDPGGFYRPHRDRAAVRSWPDAVRRHIAVVTFLNGAPDFDGGILRVYFRDRTVDVQPSAGLLVAFPADLLHEVTPVSGGTRDAIVDWIYEASPNQLVNSSMPSTLRPRTP